VQKTTRQIIKGSHLGSAACCMWAAPAWKAEIKLLEFGDQFAQVQTATKEIDDNCQSYDRYPFQLNFILACPTNCTQVCNSDRSKRKWSNATQVYNNPLSTCECNSSLVAINITIVTFSSRHLQLLTRIANPKK
jgi:hypothetical protein